MGKQRVLHVADPGSNPGIPCGPQALPEVWS